MRTEGICHLKITKDPTGYRTRNLPACGAVPQPSDLPALTIVRCRVFFEGRLAFVSSRTALGCRSVNCPRTFPVPYVCVVDSYVN
jgi:hypothetical protein